MFIPQCFRCGRPRTARLLISAHGSRALGLYAQAAGKLIRVRTDPGLLVCVPRLLFGVHTNEASGVCWGCSSGVHSPGAEGVGAQEVTAAAENSLNSR